MQTAGGFAPPDPRRIFEQRGSELLPLFQGVDRGGRAAGEVRFEGNLFRHIAVMSLTSSVGLMAIFVVDLINMIYISWLQDPVKLAAAIGYAGAVLFFTTSLRHRAVGRGVGAGVAGGGCAGYGSGPQPHDGRVAAGGGVWRGLCAAVWLLLPGIVGLLGADGRTADEALHYLRVLIPSQPLLMIGMIGAGVLRAHGDARRSMMVTVWGAIVLAALDPVLILWADLGLTGAALAGWGSRVAIAGMALWPIWRHYGGFGAPNRRSVMAAAAPILAISGPAILTQLATPVGQAVVTRMVAGYGEAAVAGMAIAGRLTPVAFGVIFALSGAVGPIIGQNLRRAEDGPGAAGLLGCHPDLSGVVILVMSALLIRRAGLGLPRCSMPRA